MLIIDTSGSMGPAGNGNGGSDPDGAGPYKNSRLEMVKDAIEVLFNSGAVHSVFLVEFNSTADHSIRARTARRASWYLNLDDALAAVDALFDTGSFVTTPLFNR